MCSIILTFLSLPFPFNQQLKTAAYMKPTFTITIKKSQRVEFSIKNSIPRSDLLSTKIHLSPLFK
ncbi:hypothetical protein DMN50_31205 [Priestia megaterium]|nr:hypothetical protein CS527_09700 [Bacillus sp. Y-01]KAA8753158.1 hypothetical protein FE314_07990 [Priestia megaterium]RFB40477.1 hypothetical protein DZB86_06510 [Bacillus sp. RC]MDR4216429.1 hypothetical protein [Priestia megaterium]MDR4217450.1 hypothetical protein [Priestia megaterium]